MIVQAKAAEDIDAGWPVVVQCRNDGQYYVRRCIPEERKKTIILHRDLSQDDHINYNPQTGELQ